MNKSLKIFVVDDDPFCLYLYHKHLNKLGYKNVTTFDNGAACMTQLSERPDVILLDHNMDEMAGLTLLKAIKRVMNNIYVVFVSGQESFETVMNAMQSGAYEYIFKGEYELENITKALGNITAAKGAPSPAISRPSFLKGLFEKA